MCASAWRSCERCRAIRGLQRTAGIALEVRPKFLDAPGRVRGRAGGCRARADESRMCAPCATANLRKSVASRLSAVRLQAVLHQQEILFELGGAAIGRGSVDGLAALLQLVKHVGKKAAIALCRVVGAPRQMHAGNAFVRSASGATAVRVKRPFGGAKNSAGRSMLPRRRGTRAGSRRAPFPEHRGCTLV